MLRFSDININIIKTIVIIMHITVKPIHLSHCSETKNNEVDSNVNNYIFFYKKL